MNPLENIVKTTMRDQGPCGVVDKLQEEFGAIRGVRAKPGMLTIEIDGSQGRMRQSVPAEGINDSLYRGLVLLLGYVSKQNSMRYRERPVIEYHLGKDCSTKHHGKDLEIQTKQAIRQYGQPQVYGLLPHQ